MIHPLSLVFIYFVDTSRILFLSLSFLFYTFDYKPKLLFHKKDLLLSCYTGHWFYRITVSNPCDILLFKVDLVFKFILCSHLYLYQVIITILVCKSPSQYSNTQNIHCLNIFVSTCHLKTI